MRPPEKKYQDGFDALIFFTVFSLLVLAAVILDTIGRTIMEWIKTL